MPDDQCGCNMKYRTGGQLVGAVNLIVGLALLITGFVTIDYNCNQFYWDNDWDDYYDCYNENWVSWCAAVGGCVCVTGAGVLLYGIYQTRPTGLVVYVALAACSTINCFIAAILAICYELQVVFVVLLFVASIWFGYSVFFVFGYRTFMISQLPRTRVILATPYVGGGHYPGAPAQIVISPGVQPGMYPAPYSAAPPGAYPGNMSPSYPYPGHSQPPPYSGQIQPPSKAGLPH